LNGRARKHNVLELLNPDSNRRREARPRYGSIDEEISRR